MLCYVNWCLVLYYTASGGSSSAFLAMFFHLGRVGAVVRVSVFGCWVLGCYGVGVLGVKVFGC